MTRPLAALLCALAVVGAAAAQKRPNVLLLCTDDQRADTIAALGNRHVHTPNLDRLATRGFVFDNAYCAGSTSGAVCRPSRHMLHSGRSLYRYRGKPDEACLARSFRDAGYVTYHESKRGNTPRVYHRHFEHSRHANDRAERRSGHHGRAICDRAIEFLRGEWARDEPLLMYLGFTGPHDPRVAAPEWMERYERAAIPLPANHAPFHPFDNGDLFIRDEKLAPWPRTEAVVREHLHDYHACITSIDHHVGRVIETLEELGELDDTIVVFTSDHGLAIGSHGLFGKQSLYEHSMKAPLIFAGPGIPKGRSAALGYLHDIFPTLCDLCGLDVPDRLDGVSQAPVIRGGLESVRDSVFLAYKQSMRAIRRGDWKLIRYPRIDRTQLFDLASDPHEIRDLAADPAHAERVSMLMLQLAAAQRAAGDATPLRVEQPADGVMTLAD